MSDDQGRPKDVDNSFGRNDPREIDMENPVERAYWLKLLEISEPELRAAIQAVGISAQKVKDFLKHSR